MRYKFLLLVCAVLLAACQPSEGAIQTAIAQTQSVSESALPSAIPSLSPTATRIASISTARAATARAATASPTASSAALPTASPSPGALPTSALATSGIYTDGTDGDVFTAKDLQISSVWSTLNGGGHNNFQFELKQRSLLEFDLSALPSNTTCEQATLYLYHSYDPEHGRPVTITIYSIAAGNEAWLAGDNDIDLADEGEACWDALAADGKGGVLTPWAGSAGLSTQGVDYEPEPLGSFTFDPASPKGTEYAVALNAERVCGWTGENNTNHGIIMVTSANSGHVAQSDHFTESYRPKLVVQYTLNSSENTGQPALASSLP